jgi:hypothetical protein
MSLRVRWQYMDRSVTKKIVYGPQLFAILIMIYYYLVLHVFIMLQHVDGSVSLSYKVTTQTCLH